MSPSDYIESWIAAEQWNKFPENLYAPIGYTLEAGGKRLRPQLVLMAVEMFGGEINDSVRGAAMALELFHNFTLLHDDVMDAAPIRRGRPTVHVRWDNNTAILSGDQMMIEAYRRLELVDSQHLPKVLHLFGQMATGICEGQQLDMDLENTPLPDLSDRQAIDRYLEMIKRKTAVLIACALQTGGVLAGAADEDIEALFNFGIALGLAFQLEDDLLDVYGNPDTFGKQIGGDIAEGKKTFLLLSAYINADERQRRLLTDTLSDAALPQQQKYNTVRTLYDLLDVRHLTEQQIAHFTDKAFCALDRISVDNNKKQPLRCLAEKLTKRQY